MPTGSTAHAHRHPRRGLAAVLVVLCLALFMAVPLGAVQADEPPASPAPPGQTEPTPPGPLDPGAEPQADPPGAGAPDGNQPEQPPYTDRVEALIAAAQSYVGKPYRLGTEGPSLFDCSGLVFRAFADAGELGRIGATRMRAVGYMRWFAARKLLTTNPEDAERGDLVIYDNGSHIGIYLGDGRVISAITSGVTVHPLTGITVPVTAFLAIDWSGKRGRFVPGVLPLPPSIDVPEAPAALVPPIAWSPAAPTEIVSGPAAAGDERVDMRTATSRTFEDTQGRFTTEFFSRPIHYLPADSTEWQAIDLHFREPAEGEKGVAIVDAAPTSLVLRESDARAGFAALSAAGLSFALRLSGSERAAVAPEIIDATYADYRDVLGSGVGLRILPRADGLKAFLVLAGDPDTNRFTLRADAPGITFVPELDGSVTLHDVAGAMVGRIARPMLLDSSDVEGDGGGVRPSAVSLSVEQIEEGAQRLTLVADRRFLDEAVYPAYVDLTLVDFPSTAASALHAFASSIHPDSNFSTYQRPEAPSYAELFQGRRPGRRDDNQAFLRFAGMHQALAGVAVESASLAAFPHWQIAGEKPRTTWLGRVTADWDARSLTWNTKPTVDPAFVKFQTIQGNWTAMDVTAHARDVISGAAPDYGFVLHADGAGPDHWKRFVVETPIGGGALEPRVVVTWTGLRPLAGASAAPVDGAVALAWRHPGLAPSPWRVEVEVSADAFESVLSETRLKGEDAALGTLTVATDGLAPGVYSWRARARYGEGGSWSAWSDAGTFVIDRPLNSGAHHQAEV